MASNQPAHIDEVVRSIARKRSEGLKRNVAYSVGLGIVEASGAYIAYAGFIADSKWSAVGAAMVIVGAAPLCVKVLDVFKDYYHGSTLLDVQIRANKYSTQMGLKMAVDSYLRGAPLKEP